MLIGSASSIGVMRRVISLVKYAISLTNLVTPLLLVHLTLKILLLILVEAGQSLALS
jgi:hypothetical protein